MKLRVAMITPEGEPSVGQLLVHTSFLKIIHMCDLLGVLTKPDRCQDAANEKWARYVRNEIETLHHGWFCVKQHDTQSPQSDLQRARHEEVHYFEKINPWQGFSRQARNRLGTKNLVRCLEEILSELITNRYAIICISSEPMLNSPS